MAQNSFENIMDNVRKDSDALHQSLLGMRAVVVPSSASPSFLPLHPSPFTPPLLSSDTLLIVDPSLDKFKIIASAYHGYHFTRSMMKHIDQDAANFYEVARAHFRDGFRTCLRRFGPLACPDFPFSPIDN